MALHSDVNGSVAGPRPSFLRWRLPRIIAASVGFTLVLIGASAAVGKVGYDHLNNQVTHDSRVLDTKDPRIVRPELQLHAANYLVIGSDTRVGQTGFGNTPGGGSDTTMLVHLSPDHTKATVISIPRDSWVTVPECKDGKGVVHPEHKALFNSAFNTGGAACTISTVQRLTGIAITHYVEINFNGFRSVIDALGTVTVCSPTAVNVNDHYSHITLKAGDNKLDGAQALEYVRLRHGVADGSDLSRIKRQQRFLGAVLREARGGALLSNPGKLTSFLNAATKAVTVDDKTSILDLKTLFDSLRGLDPKHVTFYTAPIARANYDPNNPTSTNGAHVLLDDKAGRVLYDQIINDAKIVVTKTAPATAPSTTTPTPSHPATLTVAPGSITVAVTNGTGTSGLAGKVQASLSALGFQRGILAKEPQNATGTVVKYTAAQAAAARTVAAAFPNSTLRQLSTHTGAIEVLVGSQFTTTLAVRVGQPEPTWVAAASSTTAGNGSSASSTAKPAGGISAADATCTNSN